MRRPEKVVRVWVKVWLRAARRIGRRGALRRATSSAAVSRWSSVPVNESRRISPPASAAAEAGGEPTIAAPVVATATAPRRLRTVLREVAIGLLQPGRASAAGGVVQDALPAATSLQEGSGHRPDDAVVHTRIDDAGQYPPGPL